MNWAAVSALASLASTIIVLGAAITALRQLRHMRLARQMSAYYEIMAWQQSTEALEGRRFLDSLDLSDPATLREVTTPEIDRQDYGDRRSLSKRLPAAQSWCFGRRTLCVILSDGTTRLEAAAAGRRGPAEANEPGNLDRSRIFCASIAQWPDRSQSSAALSGRFRTIRKFERRILGLRSRRLTTATTHRPTIRSDAMGRLPNQA